MTLTAETCPRCGRAVLPLEELAAWAQATSEHAAGLRRAHERMKLAVPADFVRALQQLQVVAPRLAEALRCHARTCTSAAPAEAPR